MKSRIQSRLVLPALTIILTAAVSFGVNALAFTEPASAPPADSAAAPLDTSAAANAKVGGLLVNSGGAATGLIVQYGNVGIGTTNPGDKLTVRLGGTMSTGGFALEYPSVDGQQLRMYHDGSTWIIAPAYGSQGGLSDLLFTSSVGGANALIIKNGTGNVGIGMTNPTYTLQVNKQIALGNPAVNGGASEVFLGSNSSHNFLIGNQWNVGDVFEITPSTVGGGQTFSSPAMVVSGTGKVGIGTASPAQKLDVAGNVNVSTGSCFMVNGTCIASGDQWTTSGNNIYNTNTGNVGIGTTNPGAKLEVKSGGTGTLFAQFTHSTGSGSTQIGQSGTNDAYMLLNNNAGNTKVSFNSNGDSYFTGGNVGIGTVAPLDKLSISTGNIRLNDTYKLGWGSNVMASITNYITGSDASNFVAFGTAGSERVRIDTNGKVGIGTVSPTAKLEISGPTITGGSWTAEVLRWYSSSYPGVYGSLWADESGAQGGIAIGAGGTRNIFMRNDGNVGIGTASPGAPLHVVSSLGYWTQLDSSSWGLITNGDVQANAFYYASDATLKKDVTTIPNALADVLKLRGVEFDWKAPPPAGNAHSIGVIAQEVEKIFPELVTTDPKTGLKSVEYGNLVAPLIEAIKEQQKEIDALRSEIEALKKN